MVVIVPSVHAAGGSAWAAVPSAAATAAPIRVNCLFMVLISSCDFVPERSGSDRAGRGCQCARLATTCDKTRQPQPGQQEQQRRGQWHCYAGGVELKCVG